MGLGLVCAFGEAVPSGVAGASAACVCDALLEPRGAVASTDDTSGRLLECCGVESAPLGVPGLANPAAETLRFPGTLDGAA